MGWLKKNKGMLIFSLACGLLAMYLSITDNKPPRANKGETVRIIAGKDSDDIPVATTQEIDDEFNKALTNKDVHGYNQLFAQGKMFRVKSGTKALVIDRTMNMSQVRLLEGTYEGKAGWLPVEFARKEETKSDNAGTQPIPQAQPKDSKEQQKTSAAPQTKKTLKVKPDVFVTRFNSVMLALFNSMDGDIEMNEKLAEVFSIKSHSIKQGGVNDVFEAYVGALDTLIIAPVSKENGELKSIGVMLTKNSKVAIDEWSIIAKAIVLANTKDVMLDVINETIIRLSNTAATSPETVAKEQIGGMTLSVVAAAPGVIFQVEPE
jgi:hypothetical protein